MSKGKILIIDDEKEMLENCQRILTRFGYTCFLEYDSTKALKRFQEVKPDILITDLKMPKKDGLEVLQEIKSQYPDAIVLLFTAFATIESAVIAMKEGAYDYIPKPFSSDQLTLIVDKALNQKKLQQENIQLKDDLQKAIVFDGMVGVSSKMQEIFNLIEKIAPTQANILIYGESGTGKELVAKSIYKHSKRSQGPFIPVDCASIPENLLESELFGYEKGAFTDAKNIKPGILELADKGTLFLDEIGDLSLGLQAKLLRVLQEQKFRRLGGKEEISVDFRVISATNQDVPKLVKEGKFRNDLYYRINVIYIQLPPLRERIEDISYLAKNFLTYFSKKNEKNTYDISDEVLNLFYNYHWSGNVRELQNVIEGAVTLCENNVIEIKNLPEHILNKPAPEILPQTPLLPFKEAKKQWTMTFERQYLHNLLKKHNGNISQSAREAGIDRKTIHRLLAKIGITEFDIFKDNI